MSAIILKLSARCNCLQEYHCTEVAMYQYAGCRRAFFYLVFTTVFKPFKFIATEL